MVRNNVTTGRTVAPRLTVRVRGPSVGAARLSATDFAEIVRRTQQALKRVARVLHGDSSDRRGRDRAEIEKLCELFLIGWKAGSAAAELELARPPAPLQMFGDIGEECLKAFAAGLARIGHGEAPPHILPEGFDLGVLQACDSLASVLDHGIELIEFESRSPHHQASFHIDPQVRQRVHALLGQPTSVASTVKTGRLEELNGHGGLTGRLWEPDGTKWVCHFRPEHLDQLPEAWMRGVTLIGRAIVTEGRENQLEVESLAALESEPTASADAASFWRSLSLDDLAAQQGVTPVANLDEISALWPVDDDPDELMRHLVTERRDRRRAADEGNTA